MNGVMKVAAIASRSPRPSNQVGREGEEESCRFQADFA